MHLYERNALSIGSSGRDARGGKQRQQSECTRKNAGAHA